METLIYLGKVNVYWILFYACYWFLFRKNTFFVWNRCYLIGSLLVSFVLPFIHFPDNARVMPTAVYAVAAIPVYLSTQETEKFALHWSQFVWAIQIVGASLMFIKLLESFRDLFRLIREGESIPMEEHTLVLLPHNEIGSFSFFKWLVINHEDYDKHFDPILRHESVHIRQMHTLDVLFIELLKVAFWFNPVLWFYKRSLQEVHEFLADEEAPNRDHYANFLISYALSAPIVSLTNHFFNASMLKSRIVMIYKNRNSQWALGKYFLIFPLIGLVITLTAARERLLTAVERKNFSGISVKNITVEGTVKDESGKAIKSANVVVNGGSKGVFTDLDGRFTLEDVSVGSTLVVSHINYESFSFEVNGSDALNEIILRKTDNVLPEVAVKSENIGGQTRPSSESDQTAKFTVVEQQPRFPGGMDALSQYLSSTIVYPTEAAKGRIEGKVLVSFTVNENGEVRDPRILKGIGAGLDEEAVRVVSKMPRWEPGIQGGETVSVQYNLPVNFQLADKKPAKFYNYSSPSDQQQTREFTGKSVGTLNKSETKSGGSQAINFSAKSMDAAYQGSNNTSESGVGQYNGGIPSPGLKITLDKNRPLDPTKKPLYVLDGKVIDLEEYNKTMNPDKIESINVLKGSSATSIYGSKAENGVIIIKSKKN
ncbi:TonB family protein [Dyadobacter sp. CY345]|uniref:M56 family metallopeptidase n=1 Tax=Dyadobacter sp. CY345 TaxID=2909335 RepID=UPI001F1A1DF2|nr:M56 family metallopeptidase [Dyadobacter sp. CY345]MCF2446159.1 TonB family protein [Dyadobacter sp. CY345]